MKSVERQRQCGAFTIALPEGDAEVDYEVIDNRVYYNARFTMIELKQSLLMDTGRNVEIFGSMRNNQTVWDETECHGSGWHAGVPIPLTENCIREILRQVEPPIIKEIQSNLLSPSHVIVAAANALFKVESNLEIKRLQLRQILQSLIDLDKQKRVLRSVQLEYSILSPTSI